MNDAIKDPPRMQQHHDQANLAERIAGQAARDLVEQGQLPEIVLARIAARLQARSPRRRPLWLAWGLVAGAFLLGVATAASAARLDLVPHWLTEIVRGTAAPTERTPPAKTRSRAAERLPGPGAPVTTEVPDVIPPPPAAASPARLPSQAQSSTSTPASPPPASSSPSTSRPGRGTRDGGGPPVNRKGEGVAMLKPPPTGREPRPPAREMPGTTAPALLPLPAPTDDDRPEPHVPMPSAPSASRSPRPATTLAAAPAARPTTQADPAPPPLVGPQTSAEQLRQVVHALRVEHAPRTALALLDRHADEFTGKAFAEEALLLRVEAMLTLGQRTQVLYLLDGMSLADVAAARALLVTRGELRAAANRCAESIADFDLVLAQASRPPKQALLGRARCKQRLGDESGAQADLDRYRREGGAPSPRQVRPDQ